MIYYVAYGDSQEKRFEENEQDELLDYCINQDYYEDEEDWFDEYLNDSEGCLDILGYQFDASDVLKELNRYAYDEEKRIWAESEVDNAYENARYDLRHADVGDRVEICNYSVRVYEEQNEEPENNEQAYIDLETSVKVQNEQEKETQDKNAQLENDFMTVFHTLT